MAEHAVHSTAYANPRLPPFPHPTVVLPLAQLRQPSSLSSASSLTSLSSPPGSQHLHGRQRHHSTEESHSKPLRVAAVFAKARSWLLDPPGLAHETPTRLHRRPVDSLFVIAGHGALIQYDLDPRHASSEFRSILNTSRDLILIFFHPFRHPEGESLRRVADRVGCGSEGSVDPRLALEFTRRTVAAAAVGQLADQGPRDRQQPEPRHEPDGNVADRRAGRPLVVAGGDCDARRATSTLMDGTAVHLQDLQHAERVCATFDGAKILILIKFKLYRNSLAHIDVESVEIGASRAARSTPMNMPLHPNTSATARPLVPVLIESGSCSKLENFTNFQFF